MRSDAFSKRSWGTTPPPGARRGARPLANPTLRPQRGDANKRSRVAREHAPLPAVCPCGPCHPLQQPRQTWPALSPSSMRRPSGLLPAASAAPSSTQQGSTAYVPSSRPNVSHTCARRSCPASSNFVHQHGAPSDMAEDTHSGTRRRTPMGDGVACHVALMGCWSESGPWSSPKPCARQVVACAAE